MIGRSGDWLSAKVGDEIMMMSAARGNYLGVNAVGARIWELIETPSDMDTICAVLVREFEVDEATCRAEVEQFVAEMGKHGAVTIDAG